ncbi:MAG TPA: hypothetical protein VMT46_20010 [Anaerolineaceae bacterium]|nr:hypothetical protein [Anaerolineaceae bacterium]
MAKKGKQRSGAAAVVEKLTGAEAYRPLLGAEEFEQLLKALEEPLPAALRINALKISAADALATWPEWYGWEIRPVLFCPAGWQLLHDPERRPSLTPEYKLGFFFLQDAASMLPAELFTWDEVEQPLILDLAAAPGGKSTHLASLSGDRGLLLANDNSYSRIAALKSVLQDWGAFNALVTNLPGEKIGGWLPEQFDRVLLDAPCSMDNLRLAGKHARRPVSARERQGLAQRQVQLLASAIQAAKPGGQIVYSTCTLAPEEDEGVLDSVLRMLPGIVEIEEVQGLPIPAPALSAAGGREFSPQVRRGLRLWPHLYGTSGFFAARLRKLGSTGARGDPRPYRPFEKQGLTRLGKSGQGAFLGRFAEQYGLDLGAVIEDHALTLWKRSEAIVAIPEAYLARFADLPVEMAGLLVGEETRDGLAPSHELVARLGRRFTRGKVRIALAEVDRWLTGMDVEAEGEGIGKVLAVEDERGRLLGRGKLHQQGRLKNMLPRRLVVG